MEFNPRVNKIIVSFVFKSNDDEPELLQRGDEMSGSVYNHDAMWPMHLRKRVPAIMTESLEFHRSRLERLRQLATTSNLEMDMTKYAAFNTSDSNLKDVVQRRT